MILCNFVGFIYPSVVQRFTFSGNNIFVVKRDVTGYLNYVKVCARVILKDVVLDCPTDVGLVIFIPLLFFKKIFSYYDPSSL